MAGAVSHHPQTQYSLGPAGGAGGPRPQLQHAATTTGALPGTMVSTYPSTSSSSLPSSSSSSAFMGNPNSTSSSSLQSSSASSIMSSGGSSTYTATNSRSAPIVLWQREDQHQLHHHHASRPSINNDRAMTSASTNTLPMAANSLANRTANGTSGLYQNCISLQRQLRRIPKFAEHFLDNPSQLASDDAAAASVYDSLASPISPTAPFSSLSLDSIVDASDPVSQLARCLRLGSSLCYLFNTLAKNPQLRLKELEVNMSATLSDKKACQKGAAHFFTALTQQLKWSPDDIFRITDLNTADTNGTVRVVNTVKRFVELLDSQGLLLPEEDNEEDAQTNGSLSVRGRITKEILDTERKYVQDLEVLQEYRRRLAEDGQLSQDTIAKIFLNLDWIVDFNRKFLIDLERQCALPEEQRRIGSLFTKWESEYLKCYQPYVVHYTSANEMLHDIVSLENNPLLRLSSLLPPHEIQMFHIKPIQRMLKYHMLMDELIKKTEPTAIYYEELVEGARVARRVNEAVNEEKRKEENRQALADLEQRVDDWKGHECSSFGELIEQDNFIVLKGEVEREYHVFLFQKIILCCKENVPAGKVKVNKSNSMIRKSGSSTTPGQQKRKPSLQLKGRIFTNNIVSATMSEKPNDWWLTVTWRGDSLEENFGIKCRTPELLVAWQKAVTKCVEDAAAARHSAMARGRLSARRLASPHSQFPNTPQTELGPMLGGNHEHGPYTGSTASLASSNGFGNGPHPYGTFDDEGDDGYTGDYEPSTGRSTPSMLSDRGMARRGPGTQSLPPGVRQQDRDSNNGRPRAQTEDSNSAIIHQWRSQTPNGSYLPAVPSMPRQSSASHEPSSLRHSTSRSALRSKQSQEWNNSSAPSLPGSYGSSTATPTHYRQLPKQSDLISMNSNNSNYNNNNNNESTRMLRQNSQGTVPVPFAPAPRPMRNRSASSPHVYQLPNGLSNGPDGVSYPVQDVHPAHFMSNGRSNTGDMMGGMPLKRNAGANASTATIASTTGSATTVPPKRFSSSSTGTDRSSGDSSQSGLPYTSPVSPINRNLGRSTGGNAPPPPPPQQQQHYPPISPSSITTTSSCSSAIKIRVSYAEDSFVIVATATITYTELVEKVARKVHLCGARTGQDLPHIVNTLRLRYEDEEGDKILMTADDDVMMAFDWLRSSPAGPTGTLHLFAD